VETFTMHIQANRVKMGEMQLTDVLHACPIDMSSFLTLPHCAFDAGEIPYHGYPEVYHPNTIAQFALAHWNQYVATRDECHSTTFLAQAYWLVTHETRIGTDAGGWPITLSHPDMRTEGPWLSALTQSRAISVLLRAYLHTQEEPFIEAVRRAVRTFELDILDGGVRAPVGEEGIFFEEVAIYPAAHVLSGFMFALLGLYDYVAVTGDVQIETLIHRSLTTMHSLLNEFDVGYWTRFDLLHRRLASPAELSLQAALLEALATYSGCEHCSVVASRWKSYRGQIGHRLRHLVTSRCASFVGTLLGRMQSIFFPRAQGAPALRVCVPITAFPFVGGMRTVLARVAQVTEDSWQLEYLTQLVGPHADGFVIHRFGTARMFSSQFPNVLLYMLAGFCKLISLLRREASYHVILPQDGTFTSAFAALAAKVAGVRCVCIDHGNLGLLKSRIYRTERLNALATKSWPHRLLDRLRYLCYWPFLYLLAWCSARLVDHYFVPGVTGDGVEEVCRGLGVPPSRITRFANMIDIERHIVPDAAARAGKREGLGIAADAIVITIVCRLAPEKGLEIALEAISQALSTLLPHLQGRVRVIIAGDGPLQRQIEEDICLRGLSQTCLLWGEASADEVISLLGASDIFLFTSWRAAGYPLAILEAMASGCAVIASTEPLANEYMLAEGRGIIVPVGNAEQTARALVRLVGDEELRGQMGRSARNYVAIQHSASTFRRALMRVTYWSALDAFLRIGTESER
jgi:glycosyltransferase involved in cell wall biosynthesis